MNNMSGKVVMVTGGTSGIGYDSEVRLAKEGATVIVTGRNEQRGIDIVHEIRSMNCAADFCPMDLKDEESISSVVSLVKTKYNRLDALFNNAGMLDLQNFEELTKEECREFMDVYLVGTILVTQKCLPLILEANGVILNNASICGLAEINNEFYLYSMAKAAIIKMTRQLAKKYARIIRVNAICPGTVETAICNQFNYEEISKVHPRGKVGRPEEIAAVANFLLSDDASYMNGSVITVDGGESL